MKAQYKVGSYGVIVIGAGHAGCEAALASARMGVSTLLVTMNLDMIAMMPCNPSVGGPAKAQLVREIDALGGQMGLTTDKTRLQIRMLNTGKGPAVQALRAQADKYLYQQDMIATLLAQANLDLLQAEVEDIICQGTTVQGIITRTGASYDCRALVITTGTYLKGKIIVGDLAFEGGPNNQFPARRLADSLRELGITLGRFKTGTPPRIDGRSVNYSQMEEQPGDEGPLNFSFMSSYQPGRRQLSCWLTHSNARTHEIVRENLHRSPLFNGTIQGIGPRYCPSFEDKVVRFTGRDQHQVFIEPEGFNTDEMYVQGMNTSMPEEVQLQVLRSIAGLQQVKIIRTGYAIEYDYIPASQLKPSLEVKGVAGLFTAGQINGTSGYEEAAAQGLMAGINAAQYTREKEPFTLKRSQAYIGVLIDDLVTKELEEPYRLLTSRSEYRLLLRQDNADLRLTEIGRQLGLVDDSRWRKFSEKSEQLVMVRQAMQACRVESSDEEINQLLQSRGSGSLRDTISAWELLKRPEVTLSDLQQWGKAPPDLDYQVAEQLSIHCKYEGYVKKQLAQVEKYEKLEDKRLAENFAYDQVIGLSNEAKAKLQAYQPVSIGQAARIGGVSPADINVLLVHLEKMRRQSV
ncbi:MAG: tRNA uridine-5-carboxymethylaminomethyl(34) synthesis enzyme MnmG [Methylocystaceae bacterium]